MRMIADRERRRVRSELLEVITVFMALVSLMLVSIWVSGGFIVYAASCAKAEISPETRHHCGVFSGLMAIFKIWWLRPLMMRIDVR